MTTLAFVAGMIPLILSAVGSGNNRATAGSSSAAGHVARADAAGHAGGYSLFDDVTVWVKRKLQRGEWWIAARRPRPLDDPNALPAPTE